MKGAFLQPIGQGGGGQKLVTTGVPPPIPAYLAATGASPSANKMAAACVEQQLVGLGLGGGGGLDEVAVGAPFTNFKSIQVNLKKP
jgi:hypothetical protein